MNPSLDNAHTDQDAPRGAPDADRRQDELPDRREGRPGGRTSPGGDSRPAGTYRFATDHSPRLARLISDALVGDARTVDGSLPIAGTERLAAAVERVLAAMRYGPHPGLPGRADVPLLDMDEIELTLQVRGYSR